ncbi:MAG: signal peptide peptidase SppA [Phycisphaerales bacterium]
MDSNESDFLAPPPPPPPAGYSQPQQPKKSYGWRIFFGIILGLSILANIALLFSLIIIGSLSLATAGAKKGYYLENLIESGPSASKIVIINVEGIIQNEMAKEIEQQIKNAKTDSNIKALIFRIASPGGAVSASDRLYYQINEYKKETGKPVVAFMDTLAASGGYYTAAACDKIMAEPTAITGSIGVIMGHFVLQELLEMKLGIKPVVVKSGPKKDWPTSFEPVSDEQIAYLNSKLIMPTFERFVSIVAQARKDQLTPEQVRALADGSIYNAQEALDNKLIDKIGYLPDAIELAKSLANIKKAKVVEYEKPFRLESLFGANSVLRHFNNNALYELTTPQLLYLWSPCAGL